MNGKIQSALNDCMSAIGRHVSKDLLIRIEHELTAVSGLLPFPPAMSAVMFYVRQEEPPSEDEQLECWLAVEHWLVRIRPSSSISARTVDLFNREEVHDLSIWAEAFNAQSNSHRRIQFEFFTSRNERCLIEATDDGSKHLQALIRRFLISGEITDTTTR